MNGSLQNKNILLGVCGGIAAYKSAELVRRLQDAGATVRVVMTAAAMEFITPLTFQALSGYPVHTDLLDPEAEAAMGHIELARWADLILIAPATANTMARLAEGRADDLLCAIFLASQADKAIAPAMNHVMWSAPATQNSLQTLQQQGVTIFGPAEGSQACGETGSGRLLEPDDIVKACGKLFQTGILAGIKLMITAGPTFEPIDPVRYIANHSSGKMGFAMARAAAEQGATVTLIAGPVNLPTPQHVTRIDVYTAQQMHDAVMQQISSQAIFIATAAVADYRPSITQTEKIKKSADEISLTLLCNPDILAEVAALDKPPFTLGFAAETQNVKQYALDKLNRKNLNMIAANKVAYNLQQTRDEQDSGFASDFNTLQVFCKTDSANITEQTFDLARKEHLARALISLLATHYHQAKNHE